MSARRQLVVSSLLLAGMAGFPALRAQPKLDNPKLEKTRVTVAVEGKAALYYLPLSIAEQLGYFRAEGLDLDITDSPGHARAMLALSSGAADVCSASYDQTLFLQSKNLGVQSFVLQGRAPQIAFGVSTKTLPGFKNMAELKGKKIGVSALGAPAHMVACRLLARAGLKPDDVSFVGVGMSVGALQALRSGQVDAMSNVEPVMTMMEQKGEVKVIADTRTLKGTAQVFGGPMPAACLFAPNEFVQKYPNTCQAIANAVVHALKWLQTAGPGDILKTVPESYLLSDRGLYLASFEKVRESLSPDGVMPDDGPRTALQAVTDFDPTVQKDRIRLSKTFTNTFAERAKERFKA